MNQIAIAHTMLLLLKTNRIIKKEDIADQLEISVKQVQRLRNQLELAGYDIRSIAGPYGGYQLDNASFFPIPDLTQDEKESLVNAKSYLEKLNNPLLNKSFKLAYMKVIGNAQTQSKTISSLQTQRLYMDNTVLEKFMSQIQVAIAKQRRIKIAYNNSKEYVLEPYELFQVDIAWYVIGYLYIGDIRTFRLNRIQSIEILDQQYALDENFHLESHISESGFKIDNPIDLEGVIKHNSYLMEVVHSDSQEFKIIDNQSFSFKIRFYNYNKALRFILGLGQDILVTSPSSFRDEQIKHAQNVLKQYSQL